MTQRPVHKQREIRFCPLHPDPQQAPSAAPLVAGMEGVDEAVAVDALDLQVGYDVMHVSLKHIEETLVARGYHLDNSLLCKLKRALYYYTEEVERENLGAGGEAHTQVYVSRYQRLRHDCRDKRPEYWRDYL